MRERTRVFIAQTGASHQFVGSDKLVAVPIYPLQSAAMSNHDMLEPVDGAMETGRANRPAQLYRLKSQYRNRLSLSGRSIMASAEQ